MTVLLIFCTVGSLLLTDAFILKHKIVGIDEILSSDARIDNPMKITNREYGNNGDPFFMLKTTLKPPEVTFSDKQDPYEDDTFVIHPPTTTENSKDLYNNEDLSDGMAEENEVILYNNPTDVPSTKDDGGDDDDEDYDYDNIHTDLTEHPNWPLVYHDENCGRSKLPLARKSIGGRNVDIGKYPWMARLVYRSFRNDYEVGGCGGTLINNRYVITAAHCCLKDKDATLAFIRLGEYDIHRTKDCFKGNCAPQPLDVEAAIVVSHPLYKDKNKFDNDICFIRLFDEVKFTDYIQPICLPSSMETDEKGLYNKTMTVAGWGAIENHPKERAPHVLQEVNVVVKPTELCSSTLELDMDAMNQICATGVEPAQSPCPGDSGGPLMYYDTIGDSRRYVLMGVVSAGIPCSSSDPDTNPIVFTRMSTAMPWLLYSIHE